LAAYQLSTEMSSPSHLITGLSVNGFYQQTTPHIHGDSSYLSLQGTWAGYVADGIHYLMCFTELQQHSPLLIVNMTTQIIRTCVL